MPRIHIFVFLIALIILPSFSKAERVKDGHQQLVDLYKSWRAFEHPPLKNGAPDYTEGTFTLRMPGFRKLKQQLLALDTTAWPIEQ